MHPLPRIPAIICVFSVELGNNSGLDELSLIHILTSADAAYIVAACNAVPRLVEMVKLAASRLECPYDDEGCLYDDDDTVSCAHCKTQRLYDLTEPKE